MKVSARPGSARATAERQHSDATVKAAGIWIAQFARTLKTCRLYDATNPTVSKFRAELAQAASALLEEHGALTFHFTANDVRCDGESLYLARSREDNLAYPFHRDGVRGLTLQPGVTDAEVHALLDAVLAVTGQNLDDDDLVTLLWEAHLQHIDVDYIPAEGDVGAGGPSNAAADGNGPLLPWPTPEAGDPEPDASASSASPSGPIDDPVAGGPAAGNRSEDWTLGDLTVEVEASYVELDALAVVEVERFRGEFAAEHMVPPVTASLAIALACMNAGAIEDDLRDVARFLPRVLRGALATGQWLEAREALRSLRALPAGEWSEETFVQELLQPVSVTRVVERLDAQGPEDLEDFLALEREVGDPGIDWTTLLLSESEQRGVRQVLAESLAKRCADRPERLAPWLGDGRWYVVRNIVHILGWIGGPAIIGLLQVAVRHSDIRVRGQVIEALANVDLKLARPLLIRAIDGADTKQFCQVLQQLSQARDPATGRFLFAFVQQERFAERPAEERRAIYAAIASVGGDEIVNELEAELLKANWFDKSTEIHRHNIARCLARIGTPRAVDALRHASESKRPPVRQAALSAIATLGNA